jgi:hypothetical protein
MSESEAEIKALEDQFPTLSDEVFRQACQKALASGFSVMQSIDGVIYEVFPDGTRRFVKTIEPPIPVTPGTKLIIR